jgi:hypothetical protein
MQKDISKGVENNFVKSQTTIPLRLTFTQNIHTINHSHFKQDSESAWTDLAYMYSTMGWQLEKGKKLDILH